MEEIDSQMKKRLFTLDKVIMGQISEHVFIRTMQGASIGFIIGLATRRKLSLMSFGAGVGFGCAWQQSNKYLRTHLKFDEKSLVDS